MRQLRALVLDFDGLVIDSERAVHAAWLEVFSEYGVELPYELWSSMVGTREHDDVPWRLLQDATGLRLDRAALEADKRERSKRIADTFQPLPGVMALLDAAEGLGLALGIASSSSGWWVEGHLARLGLRGRFAVVRTREHVRHSKPAPDVYVAALEALEVPANEAVAFEDSAHGVAAAKAAGLSTVAVPGAFMEHADFSAADMVVPSLDVVDVRGLARLLGPETDTSDVAV